MARPREFDSGQAILDAMGVFWTHGFEGASISTLLTGMGLTKGSLYKAFKDKKSLFLTAMALYEEKQISPAVAVLTDASIAGEVRIAQVFRSIPDAVRQGDRRGCMLCSAAAGPANDDDEIAELVGGLLGQMCTGFEAALGADMGDGKRARLASLLVTQYVGLRILARAQTSVTELDTSVSALLETLDL